MTNEQIALLKRIYLGKERRDRIAEQMGISTRKTLRPMEREAIRLLLKEYLEWKGL